MDLHERPIKRRRTDSPRLHKLRHMQRLPEHIEAAPQDEVYVQGQLLRSITTALAIAGFDSVKPSALESFRAATEEYMLHFLSAAQDSMLASRRTNPIPQDFNLALAHFNLQPFALKPHLKLSLPATIVQPPIPSPLPAESPPPDLAPMLGEQLADKQHTSHPYIPSHFPPLPSRHAWQSTAVFTEREKDPRKIRERATQEGIMAEQALRKLTAANKPKTRVAHQSVTERDRRKEGIWQDVISDVLGDAGASGVLPQHSFESGGSGENSAVASFGQKSGDESVKIQDLLKAGGGMMVNHDRGHWRRGVPARATMKS